MTIDLGELASELCAVHGLPGLQLGVRRVGEVLVGSAGTCSTATGVDVTDDTVFQIGSITKAWTATLVVALAESGAIDLDAPVEQVLPEFDLADVDAVAIITPRHLLAHTGGFEGDLFVDTGRNDDVLERYVAELADQPQLHPPGVTWSYCNAGYGVLGRLVEVVLGQPWDTIVLEHLAKPLGTSAVCVSADQAILHRAAVGHLRASDGFTPTTRWGLDRSAGPAGTLAMPMADLLRFAGLHLGEVEVDGIPSTTPGRMRDERVDVPIAGGASAWGLGWTVDRIDGTEVLGHAGATFGQLAQLDLLVDRGIAIAAVVNAMDPEAMAAVRASLLAEVAGIVVPDPAGPVGRAAADDPRGVAGTYRRAGVTTSVALGPDGLQAITTYEGVLAFAHGIDEPVTTLLHPTEHPEVFLGQLPSYGDRWIPFQFYGADDSPPWLHVGKRLATRVADRA